MTIIINYLLSIQSINQNTRKRVKIRGLLALPVPCQKWTKKLPKILRRHFLLQFMTGSNMDRIRIKYGSNTDPVWMQYGSILDDSRADSEIVRRHFRAEFMTGSNMDSIWIQYGFNMDAIRITFGASDFQKVYCSMEDSVRMIPHREGPVTGAAPRHHRCSGSPDMKRETHWM